MESRDPLENQIKQAYSAPEPSDALQNRLSTIAAEHALKPKKVSRWPKFAVVGVALVAAGCLAFNVLFRRVGEAAIALIPSDAGVVITIDLVPSEMQVPAFKNLNDALKQEGLDGVIQQQVGDALGKTSLGHDLRGQLVGSGAFAVWPTKPEKTIAEMSTGKDAEMVALLAVKDPKVVRGLLARDGTVVQPGIWSYKYKNQTVMLGVIGTYLVCSDRTSVFDRVQQAADGKVENVTQLAAYREARASLPEDSNLMMFASPKALLDQASGEVGISANVKTPKWAAAGMAIRSDGLQFEGRSPLDRQTYPSLDEWKKIKPIDSSLFDRLPTGAYGFISLSQPGSYYVNFMRTLEKDPEITKLAKGTGLKKDDLVSNFERETGLSVEKDIVPAFNGDIILAVYPTAKSLDGVLMIDNANGATPVALLAKIRAWVTREAKGNPDANVEETIDGVTVWEPSGAIGDKNLSKSMKVDGDQKDIFVANIDGSVAITSSRPMLQKLIDTHRTGKSLKTDPAFQEMQQRMGEDPHILTMIAMTRVMEKLTPMMDSFLAAKHLDRNVLAGMFGGPNAGLVFSARIAGDSLRSSTFIPLDYAKTIRVIKAMMKSTPKSDETIIK